MKRVSIPLQRAQRIAEAVAASPGIRGEDIADQLGITQRLVRAGLLIAQSQGLIGHTYTAEKVVGWFPADQLAQAKAEAAARSLEWKRQRKRRLHLARKAGRPPAPQPQKLDWADVPPIRRQVEATAPLPFTCRAPASVFHLGAML